MAVDDLVFEEPLVADVIDPVVMEVLVTDDVLFCPVPKYAVRVAAFVGVSEITGFVFPLLQ